MDYYQEHSFWIILQAPFQGQQRKSFNLAHWREGRKEIVLIFHILMQCISAWVMFHLNLSIFRGCYRDYLRISSSEYPIDAFLGNILKGWNSPIYLIILYLFLCLKLWVTFV